MEGISEPECILGLSGGMDSTAVAAMCQALGKPLASFTASYGTDAPVDEIHRAEEVARALCRSWTPISISATEFVDAWKGSYAIHQQPMATSSSLGYDLLCHRIQELGYRHFMTGGSSDDLFAGNYPAYLYNLADLAERDPAAFSQELADWVDHHSTEEFPKNIGVFHAFYSQNVAVGSGGSIHPRPRLIQSEYVHSHALPSALSSAPPVTVSGPTYLDAYLKYGIWYAAKPPGQMPFIEAARHYRIDVLDPFLSEQLIRFAFTLPPRFKVRRGWNKAILREAMRGILPDSVTRQATKTGFDVPFSHWLREATLKDFVNDVLESGKNGPVGDYIDVGRLRKDIGAGAVVSPMLVWQTTNAILWLQQYKTIVNF